MIKIWGENSNLKNDEVINLFLRRKQASNHSKSLRSLGEILLSYDTQIAYWQKDWLYINNTYYSKTTSIITNKLQKEAIEREIRIILYKEEGEQ